ncbi:capsule assembly Wzi family protein [Mucilaginibacter sp. SMC90]|uniref:capsule assembly Wzi family protein n=1 Tax=Mucilaginibacter sp. SMC90 TaxID=2929803 RepID=UPI001FB26B14|nr:capsule assembly Wzi family protein [Mucilaginibacter sp. SMC90]UOE46251.1 capsule assembly Wzi family protein [Mucilaginibacter sp. SMC90]
MNISITIRSLLTFILLSFGTSLISYGQTTPVGSYAEELLRREQVAGNTSNSSSFTIRPLASNIADSSLQSLIASREYVKFNFMGIPSGLRILPISWLNEYNVNRPYGYNNGSLYPNAGYQSMLSGGFFLKAGILNVQIKPELVYAQNKRFSTFADIQGNNNSPVLMNAYFGLINGIDAPERFGTSSLKHLYPGQSNITLTYKSIEAGVSTENLWWGPGIRNSIMMSNSAPGFFHWTFNSTKPVKTLIGSFEWQIIGGNLKQSGFAPDDISKLTYGSNLYSPKPQITRYISAYSVNWQPKWLKGLYLGASAYDYLDKDSVYHNKNIIRKIIPVVIGSSVKANDINNGQNGDQQDFAYALNIRQLLPLYKAELYFEWARNDRTGSLSDFLEEPEHSAAYTLGGRKLFELSRGGFIQIKSEITHLQRAQTYLLRDEPLWYAHGVSPRDGYTNYGRYVGAGIGPGSNSFIFDISYLKNYNSYGIMLERQLHNNDLYYQAFAGTGIYNLHWVDIASTFYTNLKFKNYLLSAEATPVYTLNYQYRNGSSFNLHARINFTYFFN